MEYMTATEIKEKFKLQQYHMNFMVQEKYFHRVRGSRSGKHCWLFEKSHIEKFTREKILAIYNSNRESRIAETEDLNKPCLFSVTGWDGKALIFCDLVKKGKTAEEIIEKMDIRVGLWKYVYDKIDYLRG